MKKQDFLENDISKKQKKIKKMRNIIAFIITIIVVPYCLYTVMKLLKDPSDTYVVENGKLSEEETVQGYIVREETIIEGNNSGKEMNKVKQEQERVAKGDTIFRYASSEEDDLKKEIAKIDEEIQKVIEENENNIFSSDKKTLESQISSEIDKIYQINEISKIQEHKNNINTYLSKKTRILGENAPSNSYLKELIDERAEYEEELNNVSEDVEATDAGIVSYKVDELENVLQPDDFDKLNKEFLESLNLTSGQPVATNSEKGKIVNNYYCYMIFNSNNAETSNIELHDKIKIKIQNDEEITTTVENIIEEEDGSKTIALKLKSNTERLIEYRKISFDIVWWKVEGFRVPNSTILEEDNLNYVIRNRNGYFNKMPVKILKKGEEYSIIAGYSKKELLELGLSEEEISDFRTITLYDRIQLNPTS